jgi:hypothetical protein
MDTMRLHTERDSFRLVDAITSLSREKIDGYSIFQHEEVFLGIEAMAQLAALHVRYLVDYQEHAFLLKIDNCSLPGVVSLSGSYEVHAVLTGYAARSYAYRVTLCQDATCRMQAEFLIATRAYANTEFDRNKLEYYYRKVVTCLQNV